MIKAKFPTKFIAAGMLPLVLGMLHGRVAQAQRPVFLLESKCVGRGGQWQEMNRDVSVGRELLTTVMYMKPYSFNTPAAFTCRITPVGSASRFKTLQLSFGMGDTASNPTLIVNVWLDGNQVGSRSVSPGQAKSWPIDVTNAKSLAVEVSCSRSEGCGKSGVLFFKAELEPTPASPGQRN